ncbi:hypothetical protein BDV06DRAFT_32149 [Aspergillus oleicola]
MYLIGALRYSLRRQHIGRHQQLQVCTFDTPVNTFSIRLSFPAFQFDLFFVLVFFPAISCSFSVSDTSGIGSAFWRCTWSSQSTSCYHHGTLPFLHAKE